ncbi:MAG: hypothetical protein V7L04_24520 [Nostoc sp.]|uniref:hypothetical protein n=1 Tax=Nostoc sp. TaxID=1180 RepID=UPI002FFC7A8A
MGGVFGHGEWGIGHGEELTCLANAQCPKRRGDYPSPPTLGLEFPVAFNETKITTDIYLW